MKILKTFPFFFLLIFLACSPEKDHKSGNFSVVKPSFEIKIVDGNNQITLGDSLSLIINQVDVSKSYSDIEVSINNSPIPVSGNFPVNFIIRTADLNLGKSKIKVIATSEEKVHSKFITITVLSDTPPELFGYEVLNVFPHDDKSYTQGLAYHNSYLFEGTGQLGLSKLIKMTIEDGKAQQSHRLDKNVFGEGICIHDDKLYQLSWRNQIGFVYDLESFEDIARFNYQGEGWGLTSDSTYLYRSDGSNTIFVHDPNNFSPVSSFEVYSDEGQITNLNELEYINGKIYANIWQTHEIAIINPVNGKLEGLINLKGLLSKKDRNVQTDVLNGIAFDSKNDRIFVTGKNWPKLFEIRIVKESPL